MMTTVLSFTASRNAGAVNRSHRTSASFDMEDAPLVIGSRVSLNEEHGLSFWRDSRARERQDNAHQFRERPGLHLVHDAGPVDFDGTRTDIERAANFLAGLARHHALHHFTFARRQQLLPPIIFDV